VTGAAIVWSFPLPQMMEEVQRANMSKFSEGRIYKREDGKVVKPPNWKPPDLLQFVKGDFSDACPSCGGRGYTKVDMTKDSERLVECDSCNGVGKVDHERVTR